jgi:hypothetical protein
VPTPKAPQAAPAPPKAKGGPASRGAKYYPRGGGNSTPPTGHLNQNGIEEPAGKKCMLVLSLHYFYFAHVPQSKVAVAAVAEDAVLVVDVVVSSTSTARQARREFVLRN